MKEKNVDVSFALIPSAWADTAKSHINNRKANNLPDCGLNCLRTIVNNYIQNKSGIAYYDCFGIQHPKDFETKIYVVMSNFIQKHPSLNTIFYRTNLAGHCDWDFLDVAEFKANPKKVIQNAFAVPTSEVLKPTNKN